MKEYFVAILILFFFSSPLLAQPENDKPEFINGTNDTNGEAAVIQCKDICLETDEHGTCIKVEVRCERQ